MQKCILWYDDCDYVVAMRRKPFSVKLDDDVDQRLAAIAANNRVSRGTWFARLLGRALAEAPSKPLTPNADAPGLNGARDG